MGLSVWTEVQKGGARLTLGFLEKRQVFSSGVA